MRLLTESESWLKETRITPRALSGLEELPRAEREATVATLTAPFRQHRTEKMTCRKDIDLWRVRVNRDVRITYRVEGDTFLVLHVGRHRVSDDFVARYREVVEDSQALEEIDSMKTAPRFNHVSLNGNAYPSSDESLGDQLAQLLVRIADREGHASKELMFEEVERISDSIEEIQDAVYDLTERQVLLQSECGKLEANLEVLRKRQHELQLEQTHCLVQVEEARRQQKLDKHDGQAQHNELADQVRTLAAELAQMKQEKAQQQAQWSGWWRRVLWMVRG